MYAWSWDDGMEKLYQSSAGCFNTLLTKIYTITHNVCNFQNNFVGFTIDVLKCLKNTMLYIFVELCTYIIQIVSDNVQTQSSKSDLAYYDTLLQLF